MLSPNGLYPLDKEIPALNWSDADPKDGDPLLVAGSPSGLSFTDYSGNAKNNPISVSQMAHQLDVKI